MLTTSSSLASCRCLHSEKMRRFRGKFKQLPQTSITRTKNTSFCNMQLEKSMVSSIMQKWFAVQENTNVHDQEGYQSKSPLSNITKVIRAILYALLQCKQNHSLNFFSPVTMLQIYPLLELYNIGFTTLGQGSKLLIIHYTSFANMNMTSNKW